MAMITLPNLSIRENLFLELIIFLTIHYADKEAQFYEFKVNAKDKIIKSNDGNQLSLTKTERRLFFYMYENRDLILTKDQIIDYVWQFESASENTLNAYVKIKN